MLQMQKKYTFDTSSEMNSKAIAVAHQGRVYYEHHSAHTHSGSLSFTTQTFSLET